MSQRNDLKDSFKDYFKELIGDEFDAFLDFVSNGRTRRTVRVNTLKISKEKLRKWFEENGYEAANNPFSSDAIDVIGEGMPLSLKLPYLAGFTYPQDSSSMFAVELLNPQPGETIIDLTAAPGGKTTHIAQRMKNTGVLIANDMDTSRLKALHSNLERLGVWNAVTIRMMPHKIAEMYPGVFDKVLLDPSCSGEGLLAKGGKPSFWSPKSVKRYASEQFGILKSAFLLLKPGGTLVYSTCTLNKFEDDGVVERLLEEFPEAEIADSSHVSNFAPPQFTGFLGFRFWPHKTRTKGFFCISIRKKSPAGGGLNNQGNFLQVLNTEEIKKFHYDLPDCKFVVRENNLFCVSNELADFALPKSYSLAFPILRIFNTEVRPTHPGAIWLGLKVKTAVYELTREEVEKLIERQAIESDKPEGDYFIKFEIFPLGYGKVIRGKLEMNFPRQY